MHLTSGQVAEAYLEAGRVLEDGYQGLQLVGQLPQAPNPPGMLLPVAVAKIKAAQFLPTASFPGAVGPGGQTILVRRTVGKMVLPHCQLNIG